MRFAYRALWILVLAFSTTTSVRGHSRACGTHDPNPVELSIDEVRLKRFKAFNHHEGQRNLQYKSCDELCTKCIEIPVAFHLTGVLDRDSIPRIPHPTKYVAKPFFDGYKRFIPGRYWTTYDELMVMINDQMTVLNESFADTPFFFSLLPVDPRVEANEKWTQYPASYGAEISAALGVPSLQVLNVFLTYSAEHEGRSKDSITVGFSSLPSWQYTQMGDGIFMRYDTLPKGGMQGAEQGYTLAHEAGKFF